MLNPGKPMRLAAAGFLALACAACGSNGARPNSAANASPDPSEVNAAGVSAPVSSQAAETAPPAAQMGGFDGAEAYAQVAKLVSFGPHFAFRKMRKAESQACRGLLTF